MNAQITTLKLINKFEGLETMRKYRMLDNYNPTIVDDLPDVQFLIIDLCEFKLRTFSNPKVNTLRLFVVDQNIPFRFFKNIQIVKTKANLKYYKEFQELQTQNELKQNQQLSLINNLNENILKIKEIIPKLTNKMELIMRNNISSGNE
ncbi:Hypothetical_protein [Hexamita inflata]|uniref:Hypothetical_protein n=1 Tax=Hexamita inflata TaxID=28002 RepID=A0AA86U557_9EUKA|nr:Hypothetical protein HINF_LOCUS30765 [Hexamita inflata]